MAAKKKAPKRKAPRKKTPKRKGAKTKRKIGRPTKFTKETRKRIVDGVAAGAFAEQAAKAAGVMSSAFHDWMARGRDGQPGFSEFSDDVEAARGKARQAAETAVHESKPLDWLRVGPGRDKPGEPGWTDRQQIEHTGKDGGPVKVVYEGDWGMLLGGSDDEIEDEDE